MRRLLYLLAITVLMASCNNQEKKNNSEVETTETEMAYTSIGEKINKENVLTEAQLLEKYKTLKAGDTIDVKFTSEVKEVCQNKGCWMTMDLGEEEASVKFKDYGFFMPKDLAGEEVIVSGKAFVAEVSVDDQRHYAEDAGKSQEEIAAITEPKRTYSVLSNGVLIPMKEEQTQEKQ